VSPLDGGFVDVHCHVLPGIDDGAPDIEASLRMLRLAAESGTATIVATPHQHPIRYPNDAARIRDAHALLLEAMGDEDLPRVLLGAEVHLDAGLPARVAAGELLTLAGSRHLLLELPDAFELGAIEALVYELQLGGLVPVLAHPERIPQLLRRPEQLRRLVDLGALGQATGSSVAGVFGRPCRDVTFGFLRDGLIHVIASDAHEMVRRTTSLAAAEEAVRAELGAPAAQALFIDNPRDLVEGRDVAHALPFDPTGREPASKGRGLLRRLFGGRRADGSSVDPR
jgi:protein-tyrosine phosphatase